MVLESLVKEQNAERHPFYVFLLGILYTSVAVLFELAVFDGQMSNIMVSITVFAAIPLMHRLITMEEKKGKYSSNERSLLQEHKKALIAFMALFLGMLISFSLWYVFLPESSTQTLFSEQIKDVTLVQQQITGNVIQPGIFGKILTNNIKVLIFSFIFSFFFGAGAIFVLTWNASVIAVALGAFVREQIALLSTKLGALGIASYFGTFSYGFLGYMTHGIFEIAAYFVAGLAGGIISVAAIKHEFFNKEFKRITTDATWLIAIAVVLLVLAGLIEVFVSPVFF